jgi:putative oxidoreductase
MNRASKATYFLLRVVSGLLFFQAGGLILFGWFGGMPGQAGPVRLLSQLGIGGVLEVVGGLAILLGLFTRPVAFVLSGMMAVAYWQFHAPAGSWPIQNQGLPAVLFCFLFLYVAAHGGGDWSLDALLERVRQTVRTRPARTERAGARRAADGWGQARGTNRITSAQGGWSDSTARQVS